MLDATENHQIRSNHNLGELDVGNGCVGEGSSRKKSFASHCPVDIEANVEILSGKFRLLSEDGGAGGVFGQTVPLLHLF